MDKRIVVLGSLLFVGNVAANAQDNPWYVGARVGATHYADFENASGSNSVKDDKDLAAGVFLGYSFNDWFGLEAGYTYLGELEIDNSKSVESNAIELVGKFTWETSDSFDVFLKAGVYGYQAEGFGLKDKDVDGTVGVGIEQHFTDDFSVRLEYQYYNNLTLNDSPYESEWDTHLLALGFIYSWGGHKNVAVTEAPMTEVVEEVMVEEVVVEEVAVIVVEKEMIDVEPMTVEVYFDFDKEELSDQSVEQLQPLIEHLQAYPTSTVVLVGHTDSRGSSELNQNLSEQRANTVSDFLTTEYAISADRISTSGEGELSPIASNETSEGRAKNRRVSVFSPSFVVEK
ncbi:porin OmpA [Psychromonas marina]|uniref:Porin OmpA n=1 Tax=Psychromonas marina TaxID=88364 RepID=A0ABQ6E0F1_9GAMM|nr:OmpA family protein [Psychromonas marina]GLS90613.1 porin OmpA [Psychromonas marina]